MPPEWLSSKLAKLLKGKASSAPFEIYLDKVPTAQNAVDLLPGWNGSFPKELGLRAGTIPLSADGRIAWCIDCLSSIAGSRVLELGPLEGFHTWMLERAGATVDAVEANQVAFLRCLVTKEILGMSRARFHLGDFLKWMEQIDRTYDLIVASGVLYHNTDPLRLMELIAMRTRAVYFWTHYINDELAANIGPNEIDIRTFRGREVRLYRRPYFRAPQAAEFCGGIFDEPRWMTRDDLTESLRLLGFSEFKIAHDEPNHRNGPAFSLFARKPVV